MSVNLTSGFIIPLTLFFFILISLQYVFCHFIFYVIRSLVPNSLMNNLRYK